MTRACREMGRQILLRFCVLIIGDRDLIMQEGSYQAPSNRRFAPDCRTDSVGYFL